MTSKNPFVGRWTYRSLLNDPNPKISFNDLQFGIGEIHIEEGPEELLRGTIGGEGWQLQLHGSRTYGYPSQVRFQGKGLVNGEEWIYYYLGWLVPVWPNSTNELQRASIVGTIVRTVPHSGSGGGVNPAAVVASWYAVKV